MKTPYYFLVAIELVGHSQTRVHYMNSLGARCSFERALARCNAEREDRGALCAVVFDPVGEYLIGVMPFDIADSQMQELIDSCRWYRNMTLDCTSPPQVRQIDAQDRQDAAIVKSSELHDTHWRKAAMDRDDDLFQVDEQDVRDAHYVTNNMNAARQRRAVRMYRQGIRFFRLYRATGPRVEVIAIEVKKGQAVVEGKRGVYTVELHALFSAAV